MTEVIFTGDIPECPNCKKPTVRQLKGSSTTLLGYSPTYDENGNCLSVDPNTKKHSYLCCECNNHFTISGNDFKGWKYI